MSGALKVGLIGTSNIAGVHLDAYLKFPEKVRLAAVCDIREDAVRRYAERAKVDAIYMDALKMLKDADIDAVDICTNNNQHAYLAIAAAEAGKHVLVEKPMAGTMRECREMVGAAEKAGVVLMVAQDLRYFPSYQGAHRLIQAGEIGRIWAARCDGSWRLNPPATGSKSWTTDGKQAGGGVVISFAIHYIDLLRYFIGDAKRVNATCWAENPLFTNGAEDRAMATLEFKNGAIGHVFATYVSRVPWAFQYLIIGEKGTIYTPMVVKNNSIVRSSPALVSSAERDNKGATSQLPDFVPVEPVTEGLAGGNSFTNEIIHFSDCCREGIEPLSSGKDNLETMKIVFGIYESARTKQAVDLATI